MDQMQGVKERCFVRSQPSTSDPSRVQRQVNDARGGGEEEEGVLPGTADTAPAAMATAPAHADTWRWSLAHTKPHIQPNKINDVIKVLRGKSSDYLPPPPTSPKLGCWGLAEVRVLSCLSPLLHTGNTEIEVKILVAPGGEGGLDVDNGLAGERPTAAARFLEAELELNVLLKQLSIGGKVRYTYNPLEYAWDMHSRFVNTYCHDGQSVLFLGMNPGPFGMAQTGVRVPQPRPTLHLHSSSSTLGPSILALTGRPVEERRALMEASTAVQEG
ncbi:hypothetical protein JZ751_018084 [Albula glossodonta]|uniref:Single-strand selective monofunctional uracil DNA glycosylase n=1 Tax=Albula glossodonta TaxID=121402 RepID=A0A8T2PQ35_9TELE|nr:hypothetical protein JZ751_018084 [Albula glossodonta]